MDELYEENLIIEIITRICGHPKIKNVTKERSSRKKNHQSGGFERCVFPVIETADTIQHTDFGADGDERLAACGDAVRYRLET